MQPGLLALLRQLHGIEVYHILEAGCPILSMVAYVVSLLWVCGFRSAVLSVIFYGQA